jgi:nucleoside-diphosphate-sugar epimerase
MKTALVMGAGGFIGGHLVARLKSAGFWVRAVDIQEHEYRNLAVEADDFFLLDLRSEENVKKSLELRSNNTFDEVYQLAADMGGAGYIFTGENDADVMHNSAKINLNVAKTLISFKSMPKIFYSSSACMYPERNQLDPDSPNCSEDSAYPADPDSEYGWEKLFSERIYLAFHRNYGLDVRIARFHNIFGPYGAWNNGREKAPAAICRKVSEASDGGEIDIWGDGRQTRSFLYIDECLEGVLRLMKSNCVDPVNIGSDEMVSINRLAEIVREIAGKSLQFNPVEGPQGVRGRNSDNRFIEKVLGWKPSAPLSDGLKKTYQWIDKMVNTGDGLPRLKSCSATSLLRTH